MDVVLSLLPGGVDVGEGRGGEGREAGMGQVNVSTILKAQDVVQRCAAQVYNSGLVYVFRQWFIFVDAQRRGRRTARRSQARLHRAAAYLAAFVEE